MNNINFTAQKLNTINIKKLDSKGEYKPCEATFVELDPKDPCDFCTIESAHYFWDGTFNKRIYADAVDASFRDTNKKFYALTTQKSGFDYMVDNEVLGLAECSPFNDSSYIDFLQVKPEYITRKEDSWPKKWLQLFGFSQKTESPAAEYSGIGKAIVNSLKLNSDCLTLNTVKDAKGFYEKLGFKVSHEKNPSFMKWRRESASEV